MPTTTTEETFVLARYGDGRVRWFGPFANMGEAKQSARAYADEPTVDLRFITLDDMWTRFTFRYVPSDDPALERTRRLFPPPPREELSFDDPGEW